MAVVKIRRGLGVFIHFLAVFGCFWCFWLFLAVFAFFDYFFLSVFSLYFACRIAPFSPTNSTVNAFLGVGFGY